MGKLRLHIRTDFRSGNSGAKNSTADFGHGVASYLSPTGLEQKGKNLNLSSVTSGGNFSSRDKLAGPSIAGRKVSSMNSSDTQTCDTIDFIFECLWKDKDFLQQKYVIEGLSIAQIAGQILSSREAVRMGLVEHGIKRKRRGSLGSKVAQVPYGYRRLNGALVPHLVEQRVIQSVKKMSSDGLSYRKICDFLTSVGVPTKNKGRGWQPEMIRRILTRQ